MALCRSWCRRAILDIGGNSIQPAGFHAARLLLRCRPIRESPFGRTIPETLPALLRLRNAEVT